MEQDFHRELKATIARYLHDQEWTVRTELSLPNHKIADIAATHRNGKILIVEIKTTLKSYLICEALLKYSAHCDAFYVAAPMADALRNAAHPNLLAWQTLQDRAGLIGIRAGTVTIIRQACPLTIRPHVRLEVHELMRQARPGW